ncbi:MAG: hypothetical protein FOGNACKC_00848 [Anaerolineae bacterium]|nr:hypothetical protein [Anaerolineae bacterium]
MDGRGVMYDKPASPAWAVVALNGENAYVSLDKVVGGVFVGVIESGRFYGSPIIMRSEQMVYA